VATNPRPFPELLNAVLSPFQDFPKDVSAAGHFMLLHGKPPLVATNLQASMPLYGPKSTMYYRTTINSRMSVIR